MTASTSTATVLFVDDEPNVTDGLKRALRREPYEFLTATSGAAALKILEGQYVDVVVSDEQMPGMSGSVFLSTVRKQFPHTIRMILSGQASLEAAVRAINEGQVHRFFLKHPALRHGTWGFGGPRLHEREGSTSGRAMICLAMVLAPAFHRTSFQWATPISDRTGTSA
jgi:CheY-like chemotaxis protein